MPKGVIAKNDPPVDAAAAADATSVEVGNRPLGASALAVEGTWKSSVEKGMWEAGRVSHSFPQA
jgi:hypothetical protein